LRHRPGLGLPQQMEDRRHLQHGAERAAVDRRQVGVADQRLVIAHASQQLAGAVLGRDAHPFGVGDRLGKPAGVALPARFGQPLDQAAAHLSLSRSISLLTAWARVTSPLVSSMKVPAAAATGSLGSPWWAKARVKATERVMR